MGVHGPFDPTLEQRFAYLRRDTHVNGFEGWHESVRNWTRAQDVAERWIHATAR